MFLTVILLGCGGRTGPFDDVEWGPASGGDAQAGGGTSKGGGSTFTSAPIGGWQSGGNWSTVGTSWYVAGGMTWTWNSSGGWYSAGGSSWNSTGKGGYGTTVTPRGGATAKGGATSTGGLTNRGGSSPTYGGSLNPTSYGGSYWHNGGSTYGGSIQRGGASSYGGSSYGGSTGKGGSWPTGGTPTYGGFGAVAGVDFLRGGSPSNGGSIATGGSGNNLMELLIQACATAQSYCQQCECKLCESAFYECNKDTGCLQLFDCATSNGCTDTLCFVTGPCAKVVADLGGYGSPSVNLALNAALCPITSANTCGC